MRSGVLAAWTDPCPIPPVWKMTTEQRVASPLYRHRLAAIEACHAWRLAAQADGWSIRATYPLEPFEQAWTAERDGFKVLGIARPDGFCGARLPVATLHIWGPDGLAVSPPPVYDFAVILAGARSCFGCDATDVDTVRVAFVGRYCVTCAERERPIQEREGWCE